MTDSDPMTLLQRPTKNRPLLGTTLMLVEDSRFAAEGVRLMAQASGARIRRADCLVSASKHLRAYRPDVAMIDLGLPDGDGLSLIKDLARSRIGLTAVIGLSGSDDARAEVMEAGADAFLDKSKLSLALFQSTILEQMPPDRRPLGPRLSPQDDPVPDTIALRDDLGHMQELLSRANGAKSIRYLAQFAQTVSKSAGDPRLGRLASDLAAAVRAEQDTSGLQKQLSALVKRRFSDLAPI